MDTRFGLGVEGVVPNLVLMIGHRLRRIKADAKNFIRQENSYVANVETAQGKGSLRCLR